MDFGMELSVMIIGDADHFIQMLDIKYMEKSTTRRNIKAKNIL